MSARVSMKRCLELSVDQVAECCGQRDVPAVLLQKPNISIDDDLVTGQGDDARNGHRQQEVEQAGDSDVNRGGCVCEVAGQQFEPPGLGEFVACRRCEGGHLESGVAFGGPAPGDEGSDVTAVGCAFGEPLVELSLASVGQSGALLCCPFGEVNRHAQSLACCGTYRWRQCALVGVVVESSDHVPSEKQPE